VSAASDNTAAVKDAIGDLRRALVFFGPNDHIIRGDEWKIRANIEGALRHLRAVVIAEYECPECGHVHDHEWTLCHNCGWDSAR
jgi:hypothetical protein